MINGGKLVTAQPCHCEAVFAEAVSRAISENALMGIAPAPSRWSRIGICSFPGQAPVCSFPGQASSQKTLLAMTKVGVFYDG